MEKLGQAEMDHAKRQVIVLILSITKEAAKGGLFILLVMLIIFIYVFEFCVSKCEPESSIFRSSSSNIKAIYKI